jgi:hypothetical protein
MLEQLSLLLLASAALSLADGPGVILSRRAPADFALTADPDAAPWKGVEGIFMENGPKGGAVPGYRSEVRSRWTSDNIYFLFVCPYETLHLKPHPTTAAETNQLWDWDVAEVFVGWDFAHVRQYKEFEVSPQGEWVDLDIDRDHPKPEGGWLWNSGFAVKARIDAEKKIWYGEMRIPLKSIEPHPPAAGLELRINFYRCQGPPPQRKFLAWQPTNAQTFHVPEAFGRMKLVD